MKIILALLIFSLIVIFHELGHFLLAKKNGICVTEFAIGMGPKLVGVKKGETTYCIKLLPIGGSCMMLGEDGIGGEENVASDRSFASKSVWARISVVVAGPIFNFILAYILSIFIIGGIGYDAPVIHDIIEAYPAAEAGMQAGDKIISMNREKINVYREISMYSQFHQGEEVEIVYERNGERYKTVLTPKLNEEGVYLMGFISDGSRTKGNAFEVLKYSAYEVKYWIVLTVKSIGMLFRGQVKANELAGPVGIVDAIGQTYEESKEDGFYYVWLNMVNFCILLTANLGVMNLLPIPALDGGRLVFLLLEVIRRKKIPPEKEGVVHLIGMMFLLALMVFVMFNDIKRLM